MNGPNLGVLRSAVLPMLTAEATISRDTGGSGVDEWGFEVPGLETVYSGPVLVRPEGSVVDVSVGGMSFPVSRYDVTLPANTDARIDDQLTVTTAADDPTLAGQTLRLTDVPLDTWQVARFCKAEAVVLP